MWITSTRRHSTTTRPTTTTTMFTVTTTTTTNVRCAVRSAPRRARRAAVRAAASDRELREGELSVKKGLLSTFIKDGEEEVTAEKYQAYQAEIAARKAEAQKRAAEARANRKGPFGLW